MSLIAAAEVTSEARYAQRIHTGAHELTADEPVASGGQDTGPAPYQLLLSSLGACTSITLRMYADRKSWDLGTITVRLELFKSRNPTDPDVIDERIEREIRLSAPLSPEQIARLGDIAERTPVTRTLKKGSPIATRVVGGAT